MNSSKIELARLYVEASNEHDLERIRIMFADDAIYKSSRVGVYEGADAIIAMMTGFFARFPNVFWRVGDYREDAAGRVVFDFVMTATSATEAQSEAVEVHGLETIVFDAIGLVSRIDVVA